MNWFKKAYNISTVEPNSYYVVVSPIQFYEWRFAGVVPEGTKCSKLLPPSDIITYDQVIASIIAQPHQLNRQKTETTLGEDVKTSVVLKVGQLQNPTELLQRYHNLLSEFSKKFEGFKSTSITQQYIISRQAEPRLYRLTTEAEDSVKMEYFGAVKEISENIAELRTLLQNKAQVKSGRAYEMADFRKVENIYTYINNVGIPIDPTRFQLLIRESNVQPQRTRHLSWKECYLELTPEAQDMYDKINHFQSLKWVQAALRFER